MALILFNTLTRKKEEFKPLNAPSVGLYTCGPTVYNYLHVGNYRTYVFEDVLKRALRFLGFQIRHVMNITDVGHLTSQADEGEDKVEAQAAKEGKTAWDIARFYESTFIEDIAKLDIDFRASTDPKLLKDPSHRQPGDILCRATEHIPKQIELVQALEKKGLTYRISDGIYFDTSKFKDYGRLMGEAHVEGLKAGARVEANPEKKNLTDFALWKFSPAGKKRQMEWNSPWGIGFPGWHIECSAMAMQYLGDTFDIHCGGVDHIPIHHTNEIAQAEGATGKPFVRVWMHGEFLLMNQAKMAKSSGGFIRLQDLGEKGFDPLDYRYLCLTAHYRKQLDFSWDALEGAKSGLRKLRDRLQVLAQNPDSDKGTADKKPEAYDKFLSKFKESISDDLNMPSALAVVWDALKSGDISSKSQLSLVAEADRVLGLRLVPGKPQELPADLQKLVDNRAEARKKRDFAAADALRHELATHGILVEDTPQGQRWKRK